VLSDSIPIGSKYSESRQSCQKRVSESLRTSTYQYFEQVSGKLPKTVKDIFNPSDLRKPVCLVTSGFQKAVSDGYKL
jgi:hypothetical protein